MPGSTATTFDQYLLAVRGKSVNTARAYLADVGQFARYCSVRGEQIADSLNQTSISLFLLKRMDAARTGASSPGKLSNRSAARFVSSLKAYGDYLVFGGFAQENPIRTLKPPRYSRKLPGYFRTDEIIALVTAFDSPDRPLALRNSAILHLLYSAGLRVSECAALDVNHVIQPGILRVSGKGGRQREVPFGKRAGAALEQYLQRGRPKLETPQSRYALWLNSRGGRRLTDRAMRNILNDAALLSGLAKPVSPHKLRHSCATHMLEGGADVRLLQEFLGHASLGTTQVYTQGTRTHLRDVYLETHPRARRDDG